MKIKVITLKQPWAHLVVEGLKNYETRGWDTAYRGELYIHASRRLHGDDFALCNEDAFFKKAIPDPSKLILGAIIGKVNLTDCISTNEILHGLSESETAFGDFRPNRFAWPLANPEKIDPIYCNGMLGIWNFVLFNVGEEVEFEAEGKGKSEILNGTIQGYANGRYSVKSFFDQVYPSVEPHKIFAYKTDKEVSHG